MNIFIVSQDESSIIEMTGKRIIIGGTKRDKILCQDEAGVFELGSYENTDKALEEIKRIIAEISFNDITKIEKARIIRL